MNRPPGHPLIYAWIALLAALCQAGPASGASPVVESITPVGAQRGTDLDVTFRGQRIADALGVIVASPGIELTHLAVQKDGSALALFSIAKNARLGEYVLRLRTATGISNLRTFWVGPYKVVEDTGKPANRIPAHAMPIDMNVTVAGRIQDDAVNYYRLTARKGQRLSVEIVGMRLANAMFDPYLQILAADGKTPLLTCDDTVFALADPAATMIAPYDGNYILAVRDSAYAAPPGSQYLMHVGSFPRPTVTFPLGGQPGKPLALTFLDDPAGPIAQTVEVPADAPRTMDIFAQQDGLTAPTPNRLAIDECTNIISSDSNHSTDRAMTVSADLPLALNGILGKAKQHDFYRVTLKARAPVDVKVIARQLRSPLDSVLAIYDAQGHQIAVNDDQPGTPDSYIRFNPPADGQYLVGIADQLGRGGADYAYRIEVTGAMPRITTALQIPQLDKDPMAQTVSVPRGNRCATVVRIDRTDFNGPLALSCPDLPAGVTMTAHPIPAGESATAVVFQADANAPLTGALCHLQADSLDPKVRLSGQFHLVFNLLEFNNNPLHEVQTDRLVLAVTDPAPVSIRIDPPKVPLMQDGTIDLHVHVDRQAGFKGPVRLQVAFAPRGLQPARLDVPPDQSDAVLSLGAEPNTPLGNTPICIRGYVENAGRIMVASNVVSVSVQASPIQITLPNLRVAAGGSTTVTCAIAQHDPLGGPATVQLLGLPPGCTANDVTLSGAETQAKFVIQADPSCRTGMQPGVFLRVSYSKSGEPVVMNLGRGAMIRITSHHGAMPPVASAKEGK